VCQRHLRGVGARRLIELLPALDDLIVVIDAATADPNDTNMEAARVAYTRGRKIGETACARGPADVSLEHDLDVVSTTRRRLEAAAERPRTALRALGRRDELS
jgi:hypothetical protein